MTKITAVPWKAECVGTSDGGPNPTDVYEITNGFTRVAEYVADRDAYLISAAPDLYAALQMLHDNIDEYQRINHLHGHDNQDMRQARAALAKARGEP